jgi:hypothetical protein
MTGLIICEVNTMRVDYAQVSSMRKNTIKAFEDHVESNGHPTESDVFSLPVLAMVGYFLKVHSKEPEMAVRRYLKTHTISYRKACEVKMIVNILK